MAIDPSTWAKVHDRYLETYLHRVRLVLERHVRWLCSERGNGNPGDAIGGADVGAVRPPPPVNRRMVDFLPTDEAAIALTESIAEHDRQLRNLEDELTTLGGPSGLRALVERAGLCDIECDAVGLALAVALDPDVGPILAFVQNDPTFGVVTPALVAAIGERPLADAWMLLDPVSATQRFRLFTPTRADSGVLTPLALDQRMVNCLRGHNHLDTRLAEVVTVLPSMPVAEPHRQVAQRLLDWLTSAEGLGARVVNLVGRRDQGRESIAALLAGELGMAPMHIHLEGLAGHAGRFELLQLVGREALLLPGLSYLDVPEAAVENAPVGDIDAVLSDLGGLVVVGSAQPVNHRVVDCVVRVPELDPHDRVELWQHVVAGVPDGDLAALVQQFALGPEATVRAASIARAGVEAESRDEGLTLDHLWSAARQFVGRDLGELAQSITPVASWDQLVLPESELDLLRSIIDQVSWRATVYQEWGFGQRLSRGLGVSALFAGPPGTGKTMAAEIMARELRLDLYRIDLSAVVSKYIGETEKNLRRVFDAADLGGAILFFDEADALFGKRTEVKDSHDRHANVEINYLLQRMEDYKGLSILATNRKADLDPAFFRRIRFAVSFPFPRPEYRRRIWEMIFPAAVPVDGLDHAALARLEIAGGNIRNIALNAAFEAAAEGKAVTMAALMRAAVHEYRKNDKMPSAGEFGPYFEAVRL